jgi:hypothetical protein
VRKGANFVASGLEGAQQLGTEALLSSVGVTLGASVFGLPRCGKLLLCALMDVESFAGRDVWGLYGLSSHRIAPATLLGSTKLSVGPDSSFHHTRRVILPTHCYYLEQRRSGDLRKFAYEFWMFAQYTDQNGSLVIGL